VVDSGQDEFAYAAGQKIASADEPLSDAETEALRAEHLEVNFRRKFVERLLYSLASFAVYFALFVSCGFYVFVHDRSLFRDFRRLSTLLGAVVVAVSASEIASWYKWQAECIPLVVFGMTVAIAYRRELAFILSLAVSLMVTISVSQSLAEFIILTATVSGPILSLNRVRSRTKLIYVGLAGAAFAFLTVVVVSAITGQAFAPSLSRAAWYSGYVILAGFLMTGLLPFMERLFDVQTDISLLELGDAAHPLLQELARRAPGTYNHSINVASLAEPAAEAVGANGLQVRVGAYFHDIGKMLKPSYFIENQGMGANQHDSLLPAMSTLVIIAHVKDGADLGRQHRLPRMIVDFVEQHHGTTLVEYFYRQAERQNAEDPNGGEVDESRYRYPGPKPQTKEAAVLMLADAAEGACRSLIEPTPARIESLVHDLAMKRLLDGQFDDCRLTLRQLHLITETLVKSLTAVYHGRIVYPDQQTA
jgi:putative nucleotidyltransferase with HDIG domain